jgi:hypothetical protein
MVQTYRCGQLSLADLGILRWCQGGWSPQRLPLGFSASQTRLSALDEQAAFKLRHRRDNTHCHLPRRVGQIDATQRSALHADAHRHQPVDTVCATSMALHQAGLTWVVTLNRKLPFQTKSWTVIENC